MKKRITLFVAAVILVSVCLFLTTSNKKQSHENEKVRTQNAASALNLKNTNAKIARLTEVVNSQDSVARLVVEIKKRYQEISVCADSLHAQFIVLSKKLADHKNNVRRLNKEEFEKIGKLINRNLDLALANANKVTLLDHQYAALVAKSDSLNTLAEKISKE